VQPVLIEFGVGVVDGLLSGHLHENAPQQFPAHASGFLPEQDLTEHPTRHSVEPAQMTMAPDFSRGQ
jgi:hypothetical protein